MITPIIGMIFVKPSENFKHVVPKVLQQIAITSTIQGLKVSIK